MLIEIFRQSLSNRFPGLRFLFQRCQFELKANILWISCSDNYWALLNLYRDEVEQWAKEAGYLKSVSAICLATPRMSLYWVGRLPLTGSFM